MRLALILVAAFMVVLDFSIVNVALPAIESELAVTTSVAQWVVTGYAIAFGGLLILGGRAADLFGRRRMFIAGLSVFSIASLAGGLAQDPVLLILSRVVQGAGAAVVAPAALSLITTSFPEGSQRTRAIGLYGSISSVGFVSGQVLGGVLIEWTDWRSAFLVNVPLGLVAVALAPRLIGPDRAASATGAAASGSGAGTGPGTGGVVGRLDIRGAISITAAVSLAVFAISQAGELGWTSPVVLGALAGAIAAGAGFVGVEARHPEPLIRPGLLLRPGPRDGAVIAMMLGLWNGGEMLALSLYLQQALHYSPLATGLVIAPQGIAGFTSGLMGPKVAARFGVHRTLVGAGVIAAAGFVALSWLPSAGWSPLLLMVIPVGLGTAGTSFGAMVLASRGMADSDQGLAGGVINTSRQVGAAIGAALLPAIAEAVHGVDGDRDAMLTAAGAAAAAALLVLASARRPRDCPPNGTGGVAMTPAKLPLVSLGGRCRWAVGAEYGAGVGSRARQARQAGHVRLTVLGSLNMDISVAVPGLPGPGATVLGGGAAYAPGGKGANQAVAAARLGAAVRMVGCVGDDDFGARLREALKNEGVADEGVRVVPGAPTGLAMITVDAAGENIITVAPGANREAGAEEVAAAGAAPADALVISAEIPVPAIRAALSARNQGLTVLNLAPAPPEATELVAAGADWLIVNESEAGAVLDRDVTGLDDAARAASEIAAMGARGVVVTAGAAGAAYYAEAAPRPAEAASHHAAEAASHHAAEAGTESGFAVDAVDSVGAGDTFVGALAVALAAGVAPAGAVRAASAAGAAAATRPGTQAGMPDPAAVLAATGFAWPLP